MASSTDGQVITCRGLNPLLSPQAHQTFSECTVIHEGYLAKIHPDAPLDKVCVINCGFSTGFGAMVNVAKPKPGMSVAVFGLGAVGLAAAEGARVSGASRAIGVDSSPRRFDEAKKFGVTEFVNPKNHDKPMQEVIAEMTNGGVDRAVECAGNVNAIISSFECVHDVMECYGTSCRNAAVRKSITILADGGLRMAMFGIGQTDCRWYLKCNDCRAIFSVMLAILLS